VRVTEVIEVVVHMRTSPRAEGRKTPSKPKQKAEPSEPRIVGTYTLSIKEQQLHQQRSARHHECVTAN
jgi:hypothetical protein